MALNWQWSDKMGEVTDERGLTANLYRGNAFMIAIHEWEEDGQEKYCLAWFFADKTHMKRCLGLGKDADPCDFHWKAFKLNTEYKEVSEFVSALAKAKKKVSIELY